MSDNLNSSRLVSYEQVKTIIDFMEQHAEFATGSLRTLEARHTSKRLWNELTIILNNSRLGARKSHDGWSKYWSDFKNKLKNKVNILKKRKMSGASSKRNVNPLTRIEKRALVILGPHFERKISKVSKEPLNNLTSSNCPPEVKLEACQENGHSDFPNTYSESSERYSDIEKDSNMSENSNEEFNNDSEEDSTEPILHSIYPKWLIEVEKKRAEADLSRAKAEEKRATISARNADAALLQAEALKKLADAATIQADALVRIATILEYKVQREEILPI